MPISANERSLAASAPGGLALVQELLNTAPSGAANPTADLLADARIAADWMAGRAELRALPALRVDDAGAARLRGLRDSLRSAIRLRDGRPSGPDAVAEVSGRVAIELDAAGDVRVAPVGDGGEVVAGLVLGEVLLAQERDDWARLKLCALAPCSVAFYDRTRNGAARFHTERCANLVHLRASRERHRSDRGGPAPA